MEGVLSKELRLYSNTIPVRVPLKCDLTIRIYENRAARFLYSIRVHPIRYQMAFDDPIVWIIILAVVVILFGAGKIPQFARSLGQARKEFDQASKEIKDPSPEPAYAQPTVASQSTNNAASTQGSANPAAVDPLLLAAQKEGIETQGKTRDQIATELAWKLKGRS